MPSPYLNELIKIARQDLPQIAHDLNNASTIYAVQEMTKKLHNVVTYLVHHVVLSDPSVSAAATAAAAQKAQQTLPPPPSGYRYVRGQDNQIYMVPVAQASAPAPMASAIGHAPAIDHFPSLHPAAPPVAPMPGIALGLPLVTSPGFPDNGQSGPGNGTQVVDVTITPHGSRVAIPGGPVAILPPGVPVDATGGMMFQQGFAPTPAPVPVDSHARPMIMAPAVQPHRAPTIPQEVVLPEGGGLTPEVAAALAKRQGGAPMTDASGGARNITEEQP